MPFVLVVLLILAAIILFSAIKILNEHERGVVLTLGRATAVKGPGLILVVPFLQMMVRVDLRVPGKVEDWAGTNGRVSVHGKPWNAVSAIPLSPGTLVRVTRVDGLTLTVAPTKPGTA